MKSDRPPVPDAVQLALGQCLTALWNGGLVRHDRTQHALLISLCQALLRAAADGDRSTARRLGQQLRTEGWRGAAVLAWEMGREVARQRAERQQGRGAC